MSQSQTDAKMKVTDRRMFNADGELRDEFRHIEESLSEPGSAGEPRAEAPAAGTPAAEAPSGTPADARPEEPPPEDDEAGLARFEDLVRLLAENASIHLQQSQVPAQRSENLELAKLYIDLVNVLQKKTAGNLKPPEEALLEDVLYQLRMAYTQVQGF